MHLALLRSLLLACVVCAAGASIAHPGEHQQLALIDQAIAQQPRDQALYIRRASLYSSSGHFDEAMADLLHAETLGPSAATALERGLLSLRQGDAELAIGHFNRYIEAYPGTAIAYEYRARAARAAGDKAQAVADLKRSIELNGQPHPGTYLAAADVLQEMRDTDQAIALLDQGMARLGTIPTLQHRAIELVLEQGRTDEAIARLESLRTALRESPAWKLQMTELLLQDGRYGDARILLAAVETDLGGRRSTPANRAMLEQARELKGRLAAADAPDRDQSGF